MASGTMQKPLITTRTDRVAELGVTSHDQTGELQIISSSPSEPRPSIIISVSTSGTIVIYKDVGDGQGWQYVRGI